MKEERMQQYTYIVQTHTVIYARDGELWDFLTSKNIGKVNMDAPRQWRFFGADPEALKTKESGECPAV